MDTTKIPISPNPEQPEQKGTFSFKKVPHVIILPDGTRPLKLGSGTIISLLGTGGMANVYEIWNPQLEVKRAVKLLHPNYTEESKQRFETEIKITAKLDHPNIVEIHAVGEWNGLPFIEMEKIDGSTLEKLISDRGSLPFDVCTAIGIMMCRALRYAHSHEYALYGETYHGVIHRDLKPNNIMVSHTGIVKLMDLGIARPIDASIHTTDNSSVLGTMQYLSPEQLEGKNADIRTDLYSLGTILYELITGVKAFPESNISKLMLSKIRNDYKPLESFVLKIPSRFKRAIQKCLNRDRDKRPQNAAMLLAELTKIHKGLTSLSVEAVMQNYMNVASLDKTIIHSKRHFLPRPIVVGLATATGAVVLLTVLGIDLWYKRSGRLAQQTAAARVVAPSSKNDAAAGRTAQRSSQPSGLPQRISAGKSLAAAARPTTHASDSNLVIDELKRLYATSDLLTIFVKEIESRHYQNARRIVRLLSPQELSTKAGLLYRLRLLDVLGDRTSKEQLLLSQTIDDGEYYFAKAKWLFQNDKIDKCIESLDRSLKNRCEYFDPATLRQEVMYYRALCQSRQFDLSPSQTNSQNALDSWFEVKLLLRSTPQHTYFKKAVSEMQRIGERAKGIRG
jgi:serine/threonine protein kinase